MLEADFPWSSSIPRRLATMFAGGMDWNEDVEVEHRVLMADGVSSRGQWLRTQIDSGKNPCVVRVCWPVAMAGCRYRSPNMRGYVSLEAGNYD
ncbi:hypothetical protein E2562_001880 [Oryza meyeriana var. granulata]|uniref:Uncharacterized protein n=1 Tax=Oryza meyeriana var. granulata TaxID=110450 RepID=A0A6G1C311_9ORYZ|nr:hypothetical protein E2562_001880 [Oryza meyeriana var. granulata]